MEPIRVVSLSQQSILREGPRLLLMQIPRPLLVMSASADSAYIAGVLSAGAARYLLQGGGSAVILIAVCGVESGVDDRLSQQAARKEELAMGNPTPRQGDGLTARERQVLALIGAGWTNSRIAAELCLTEQTVRNYASRVYAKLGVSSRAEAMVWARDHGVR